MKKIRVAALVLAAALASCNGDPTGRERMSAVGRYSLQSVDGAGLPAPWFEYGSARVEITAGQMDIVTDSTYTYTIDFRQTNGAAVTTDRYEEVGTLVQRADTIVFTAKTPLTGTFVGTVSGGVLTMTDLGSTWVFRKE